MGTIDDLGINQERIRLMKRYGLALLGLILFSSGLCVFGEALISKYENNNWFLVGTISLILINAGLGLMIKNKWGKF
jgi:hypothetical protein